MADPSTGKFAWGILGTGNIARQFCKGVKTSERGILMAVGSRSAGPAAEFAGQFGVLESYPTYDQVLKDPQVDAVYVSLPNSMHREWTIRALEAGKHVLCEKPLAGNEAEAREMFSAAKSAGKTLVEAFMYRAHPQTREVLEKIRGGAIGDVKLIRTSFCYRTTRIDGNIRFDPALAGGALMDIGCYCINFSRAIANADVVDVQASGTLHERGVDELVVGNLKFANGVVASFTCGMRVQADNTAYVCGTEGFMEIPWPWKPQPRGAKYWIKRSAPPRQDGGKTETPPAEEFEVNAGMDLYAVEADDFAETISRGREPMVSEEETMATMKVLDQMRKQVGVKL
jgi:xylose dehydrogenase (NAD/NADP)